MDKAKIVLFGCDQAVCLPQKYHIYSTEVSVRKEGNNIILSPVSIQNSMDDLWKKTMELFSIRERVFR